jgi:hypothetical protein
MTVERGTAHVPEPPGINHTAAARGRDAVVVETVTPEADRAGQREHQGIPIAEPVMEVDGGNIPEADIVAHDADGKDAGNGYQDMNRYHYKYKESTRT